MKKPLSDSPTFCPAPWTQIALNTDAEPRPCCAIYNSLGRYKDLPEYWNSKPLQEIRNAMLQGKWHPACSSCEKTEKHGGISKRHYEQYLLHEVLSDPDFVYDIDVSEHCPTQPLVAEIRFSNLCNLKCRMCNSVSSTKIAQEYKELSHPEFFYSKEPLVLQSYFEDIRSLLPSFENLRLLRLLGGEPFLDKEGFKLCKSLVESGGSRNIHLILTTNMTVLSDEWIRFLNEFQRVSLQMSLDATGSLIEYIRSGTDWKIVSENIQKALKQIPQARFKFVPCVQAYNLLNLNDVYGYVLNLKKRFSDRDILILPSILREPKYLQAQLLSKTLKKSARQRLEDFLKDPLLSPVELRQLQSTISDCCESECEDYELLRKWKDFTFACSYARLYCVA